jgi:hypothetical protein
MCVIEGPESIVIHIYGLMANKNLSASEVVMSSLLNKPDQDDDVKLAKPAVPRVSPRPQIRTLDVAVQSDFHPLGFVTCPPNSRKSTPFETEVCIQFYFRVFV